MGSAFDDWVYWHFFTITVSYNTSHNDVCLTDLYEESLTALNAPKVKLCYDRQSVGQSVLVSSTHLGLTTRFLFLPDSCGFVDVRSSL
jgi:hypothetical protein